ncbi:hypothetical protein SCOCK_210088 [Actinacidiphila cocklensis]|uniref:Uncharacterized protein n=1 Tax=Actinacidiphila cocklensis TaxID=887465 RepID=A0A9W4GRE6_9ACTN|nr:hypothetical protein SCOCK_210088 [Actinacidiphila cocklensis]
MPVTRGIPKNDPSGPCASSSSGRVDAGTGRRSAEQAMASKASSIDRCHGLIPCPRSAPSTARVRSNRRRASAPEAPVAHASASRYSTRRAWGPSWDGAAGKAAGAGARCSSATHRSAAAVNASCCCGRAPPASTTPARAPPGPAPSSSGNRPRRRSRGSAAAPGCTILRRRPGSRQRTHRAPQSMCSPVDGPIPLPRPWNTAPAWRSNRKGANSFFMTAVIQDHVVHHARLPRGPPTETARQAATPVPVKATTMLTPPGLAAEEGPAGTPATRPRLRNRAQRPVRSARRAGCGVVAIEGGACLGGAGGAGEVAGRVAVAAVDDAGRAVLGSGVHPLFDLPGRGDAGPLGGHLVVGLAVDRFAQGRRGAEVDRGGQDPEPAPFAALAGQVDLQVVPPRVIGFPAAAFHHREQVLPVREGHVDQWPVGLRQRCRLRGLFWDLAVAHPSTLVRFSVRFHEWNAAPHCARLVSRATGP